jgi:outer membrane protein OmpA-like peptidoglycan-associated protein
MIRKFTSGGKVPALLAAAVASMLGARAEADEWTTGIGTGVFGLNLDGKMGFGTDNLGTFKFDNVDISMSDIADVTDSAFGLNGFTTNGTWTFLYGASHLKLEGDSNGVTATGASARLDSELKWVRAELAVAYKFADNGRSAWSVLGGANYTKQDYESRLTAPAGSAGRSTKYDWTDGILGLMNTYTFAPQWQWVNRVDAGGGGSDGTYHARTSFNWDPGRAKAWVFSFYADYKRVNFENASEGDANWYKYRVSEFGPGIGFGYVFGGSEPVAAAPPPPPPAPVYVPPPPPRPPLDTDGDTVADTEDMCPNTIQGEKVDVVGCAYNLRLAVLFDDNSAALKSQSYADLNRAFQLMLRVPTMNGVIEGHTDSRGTDAHNMALSERRAKTVVDYLVDHGVDPSRIQSKGFGESQPVASNDTPQGQAENRRVVLHRADAGGT